MIQEQEYVGWLAFPTVSAWASFQPALEFSLRPGVCSATTEQAERWFRTDSLAGAVAALAKGRFMPLVYRALPQDSESSAGGSAGVRFELDWSISAPSGVPPREIRRRSRSRLWSRDQRRFGFFALSNSLRDFTIHLTVGGASAEECIDTWKLVSRWIRKLHRLQLPLGGMPDEVVIPERPMAEVAAEERQLRVRIREAVLEAARIETEGEPFNLRGRGHEPRIALTVKLAAILRGLDLPHVHIAGYGANNHYPFRVFDRAARMLRSRLKRPVLRCNGYHMYLA